MAFRPEWYERERRRPGGFGGMGNWSAMRLILTFTILFWVIEALVSPRGTTFLWDVMALRAWIEGELVSPPGVLPEVREPPSFNFLFPLQLVTYMLQHAPGLAHIFWNLLILFIYGRELNATMGRAGFLRLYLAAGVFGGLCQWVTSIITGSTLPIVGASAAVYGVMLLFTCRNPKRIFYFFMPIPIPLPVVLITALKVLGDLTGVIHGSVGTAHFAHLGGALIGFLWFKRGDIVGRAVDRTRRIKRDRELKAQEGDRREMDRILAKIQSEGLGSLSKTERSYLDERSRELRDGRK